jgi:hypothetical protein
MRNLDSASRSRQIADHAKALEMVVRKGRPEVHWITRMPAPVVVGTIVIPGLWRHWSHGDTLFAYHPGVGSTGQSHSERNNADYCTKADPEGVQPLERPCKDPDGKSDQDSEHDGDRADDGREEQQFGQQMIKVMNFHGHLEL